MTVMAQGVDLHSHTTYSDGIDTPAQLVAKAAACGVGCLAITDHDSVAGIAEGQTAGQQYGVEVLVGIELSVQYQHYDDIHLLGYGFNPQDVALQTCLTRMQDGRMQRGIEMLRRINRRLTQYGQAPLHSAEVLQYAQGVIARPHLAQALVARGYAISMQQAFRDFLIPCNVPKAALDPEEAMRMIAQAGGVCVLAHPATLSSDPQELHQLVGVLKDMGLVGLEVYHHRHYPDLIDFFRTCAVCHGLVCTGGSDYHGRAEGAMLGHIAPEYAVPGTVWRDLQQAQQQRTRESA
jgi:predicted metal-dependent phosphoesterase TrpH